MGCKKAFPNGRWAAARLPAQSGIKPGDPIRVTVMEPGKVLIERDSDLPDYGHGILKRSKHGGKVTSELVRKLLDEADPPGRRLKSPQAAPQGSPRTPHARGSS